MWLMTIYGFFSIVRGVKNGPGRPPWMIRARRRKDLVALKEAFEGLDLGKIHTSAGTDYPVRLLVHDGGTMSALVGLLFQGITYRNFKNAAHDADPDDTDYHDYLMAVWQRGLQLEKKQGRFLFSEEPFDVGTDAGTGRKDHHRGGSQRDRSGGGKVRNKKGGSGGKRAAKDENCGTKNPKRKPRSR